MPDDRHECLAAGANDYIAKPIDPDQLLSLLRVWMLRSEP
jgi:CheY-like chemotaxis protein